MRSHSVAFLSASCITALVGYGGRLVVAVH